MELFKIFIHYSKKIIVLILGQQKKYINCKKWRICTMSTAVVAPNQVVVMPTQQQQVINQSHS